MKEALLFVLTLVVVGTALPTDRLNLGYLPPTSTHQPPPNSYLPPSNNYLPPELSWWEDSVKDNVVETGEPEAPAEPVVEAPVEAAADGPAEEAAAEEVAAKEVAAEAPFEGTAAEAPVVEEVEAVGGSDQPQFQPFYDDEQEAAKDAGSLKVDQLHGVEGTYELREEGEGYRNTDAREESKLYQNVEDVKTFNSEVHEYEYYPYESYGKQVTVVEPIIGKTYGFHAVPYQVQQPGYGPLRTVSYVPVQYPAYKHGAVYRNPPGYTREPSQVFPSDGTQYIARPPRPGQAGGISGGYGGDSDNDAPLGASGVYSGRPSYNAQAVFPATAGFASAPIYAGSYSGESGYGGPWFQPASGEEGHTVATAEASTSSVSEQSDFSAQASASSVSEQGEASAQASASTSEQEDSNAEAAASSDSEGVDSGTSAAVRRSSSGQITYTSQTPISRGYPGQPAWWPTSQSPTSRSDTWHPSYIHPSPVYSPYPAQPSHQNPVPAASTTHEVIAAPPTDPSGTSGLSRLRSITGGPPAPQHAPAATVAATAAVPPIDYGLVYAAGGVHALGPYGDGYGSRHVQEGNIPGYYVRCVRHDNGPPSVSLVPFAQ